MVRRRPMPQSLEEHPNLAEILGVLAQLPHIADTALPRLAAGWCNTAPLAAARAHALEPDSPLVLEVLAAFEAVQALFQDDIAGTADYVTVDPQITTTALKAVRDAIAAAYAEPVLRRAEYLALMRAWRGVFPAQTVDEPDLGPRRDEVKAVLAALRFVSGRCHEPRAADLYSALGRAADGLDDPIRRVARDEAWAAAVLTSRRRIWTLVRRSGTQELARTCTECPEARRAGPHEPTARRVLAVCLDAACALLVADTVDDNLVDALVLPVCRLIEGAPDPA